MSPSLEKNQDQIDSVQNYKKKFKEDLIIILTYSIK